MELPPRVLEQDIPVTGQFIRCAVSPGTLLKAAVSRVKSTEEQDGARKMASWIKVFAAKPDYLRSIPRTARTKEKTVTSCSLAFIL